MMKNGNDTLYHYTSLEGALGILKTGNIWATDINYLNDSSELLIAIECFKKELSSYAKTTKPNNDHVPALESIIKTYEEKMHIPIATCSFSEDGDSLSLWRGYQGQHYGVALGFDREKLEGATSAKFSLGKCEYVVSKQQKMAETEVNRLMENINKHENYAMGFYLAITRLAPLLKNPKFRNELEWRLFSKATFGYKDTCFRVGKSMLIPYCECSLFGQKKVGAFRQDSNKLVTEIVVGPSPNPELSRQSMVSLLSKIGRHTGFQRPGSTIEPRRLVTSSNIPYRDW